MEIWLLSTCLLPHCNVSLLNLELRLVPRTFDLKVEASKFGSVLLLFLWKRNFAQSFLYPPRRMDCYWRLTVGTKAVMDWHRLKTLHETETRISFFSGSWTNYVDILATVLEFYSYLCSLPHHQYILQSIHTRRIRMCWCKQRLHYNSTCLRCIHPNL